MAWPPPALSTTRTDTTVMASTHPADHNAANLAINDLVTKVQNTMYQRIIKSTTEAGYSTTEFLITGMILDKGFITGRLMTIKYGLIISAVATQPTGNSYVYVRVRSGTTTAGAIIETHVFPWVNGQQTFGGGVIALQGETAPFSATAGQTACVTFQAGSGSFGFATGSWVAAFDYG